MEQARDRLDNLKAIWEDMTELHHSAVKLAIMVEAIERDLMNSFCSLHGLKRMRIELHATGREMAENAHWIEMDIDPVRALTQFRDSWMVSILNQDHAISIELSALDDHISIVQAAIDTGNAQSSSASFAAASNIIEHLLSCFRDAFQRRFIHGIERFATKIESRLNQFESLADKHKATLEALQASVGNLDEWLASDQEGSRDVDVHPMRRYLEQPPAPMISLSSLFAEHGGIRLVTSQRILANPVAIEELKEAWRGYFRVYPVSLQQRDLIALRGFSPPVKTAASRSSRKAALHWLSCTIFFRCFPVILRHKGLSVAFDQDGNIAGESTRHPFLGLGALRLLLNIRPENERLRCYLKRLIYLDLQLYLSGRRLRGVEPHASRAVLCDILTFATTRIPTSADARWEHLTNIGSANFTWRLSHADWPALPIAMEDLSNDLPSADSDDEEDNAGATVDGTVDHGTLSDTSSSGDEDSTSSPSNPSYSPESSPQPYSE